MPCQLECKVGQPFGPHHNTVTFHSRFMGRLVIAHHKSYHPYKAENIERVRRDEEEARLKEAQEEGRLRLAVSVTYCLHTSHRQITGLGSAYRIAKEKSRYQRYKNKAP